MGFFISLFFISVVFGSGCCYPVLPGTLLGMPTVGETLVWAAGADGTRGPAARRGARRQAADPPMHAPCARPAAGPLTWGGPPGCPQVYTAELERPTQPPSPTARFFPRPNTVSLIQCRCTAELERPTTDTHTFQRPITDTVPVKPFECHAHSSSPTRRYTAELKRPISESRASKAAAVEELLQVGEPALGVQRTRSSVATAVAGGGAAGGGGGAAAGGCRVPG